MFWFEKFKNFVDVITIYSFDFGSRKSHGYEIILNICWMKRRRMGEMDELSNGMNANKYTVTFDMGLRYIRTMTNHVRDSS